MGLLICMIAQHLWVASNRGRRPYNGNASMLMLISSTQTLEKMIRPAVQPQEGTGDQSVPESISQPGDNV